MCWAPISAVIRKQTVRILLLNLNRLLAGGFLQFKSVHYRDVRALVNHRKANENNRPLVLLRLVESQTDSTLTLASCQEALA